VASGFSLSSTYSVSAGAGVTVGWVPTSVVQGSYGHGSARNPLEVGVLNFDAASDWLTLNQSSFMSFAPSIFFAECPGEDGFAYIQTFPGLPLDEAGFNFNLVDGLSSSDGGQLDPDEEDGGYVFTPMSNFRNSAYAFWSNWVEDIVDDNPSAIYSFQEPLWGNVVQGVWVYVITEDEFASSFYSYSNGSDELTEIGIDDVFEEEAAPTTAPASSTPSTTPTTLAATGADVELLLLASLIAVVAGAGLFAFSRRKRIW
jgi:LPXTG-motif cell wall-anchored protein